VALPASARRRLQNELRHLNAFDPRWTRRLSAAEQTAHAISEQLRALGAGATCHVLSENDEIDGQSLPIEEALDRVVGLGYGTLFIAVPGVLAYFEGEELSDRQLLHRPG
jgi:hypothetical protein